ncbi:uncharacterized protein LOC119684169 [Teleopsis dalmanni]|uniref:uncharacterized protein LOC119684169 n=1 Tax=Teleopsis dalmanni TaxID=139649 RepID=UPI0018CCC526|nr:uncharacterized protein LOC119684169 [Teleopsis dalmanni]
MSRNTGRIDRFAQMSKQEELIAKKRQEILDRQRTSQLAKAVAEAQNLAAKQKNPNDTEVGTEQSTLFSLSSTNSVVSISSDLVEMDEKKLKTEPESTKPISSIIGKTGKISFGVKRNHAPVPIAEQPQPKVQNFFCNDGSFLDHFKKIIEKHEQPQPSIIVQAISDTDITVEDTCVTPSEESCEDIYQSVNLLNQEQEESLMQQQQHQQQQQHIQQQNQIQAHHHLQAQAQLHLQQAQCLTTASSQPIPVPLPVPVPVSVTATPAQFAFNPNILQQQRPKLSNFIPQPHALQAAFFTTAPPQLVPPPPPPTTHQTTAFPVSMTVASVTPPPPPPPPPQIPHLLANLAPIYMIPAPESLQLNAIPPPKEFDLNAIPKPQLKLEAIHIPTEHQQTITFCTSSPPPPPPPPHKHIEEQVEDEQSTLHEQAQHQQVFSDNSENNSIQMPTSIDNLIDLVTDNGDEYEDKLRMHQNELHPSMWFLFDKNCEEYIRYKHELIKRRLSKDISQEQEVQNNSNNAGCSKSVTQELKLLDDDEKSSEESMNQYLVQRNKAVESSFSGFRAQYGEDKYDPESVISGGEIDSDDEYKRGMLDRNRDNIKRRIECRNELSEEERLEREADEHEDRRQDKKKLRKSRWGEKVKITEDSSSSSGLPSTFSNQNKPVLSTITRNDPALLQYARLNYGSTELNEEDWQKCEEHYKVNLLYQDMIRKREEIDRLARSGKFKYEYDSDEDVDGGTWEHKLRCAEMEATQAWAQALTKQSEGKHHIGDFLPPEELKKFMEQYEAKKNNRQPDLSDYKEYKLREDNIGFQMLQKLGWKEGQGLGTDGAGIVDPVNKGPQREGNQGLGVTSSSTPENCDNVYDAYRKRMMLAYRFRPNPLNNPRRAYY